MAVGTTGLARKLGLDVLTMSYPVLYSFRRCPYAIRARMAIVYAGLTVFIREVELKNKPASMIDCSAKGTVPVLVLRDGSVIDESIDIVFWALELQPAERLFRTLNAGDQALARQLIAENDHTFKAHLDGYKYTAPAAANNDQQKTALQHRLDGEIFLAKLEQYLAVGDFLLGRQQSVADLAILPFIRQFAYVDRPWFDRSPYPRLRGWLDAGLESTLFKDCMAKLPAWHSDDAATPFPARD